MTDDERDVLRRARATIVELLEANMGAKGLQSLITDDIDRLLAADEDAEYEREAKEILELVMHAPSDRDVKKAAMQLKARDARRKEAGK